MALVVLILLVCATAFVSEAAIRSTPAYGCSFDRGPLHVYSSAIWFQTVQIPMFQQPSFPQVMAVPDVNITMCGEYGATLMASFRLTQQQTVAALQAAHYDATIEFTKYMRLHSTLSTMGNALTNRRVPARRMSRAIFPFIGWVSNWLFGTATEDQLQDMRDSSEKTLDYIRKVDQGVRGVSNALTGFMNLTEHSFRQMVQMHADSEVRFTEALRNVTLMVTQMVGALQRDTECLSARSHINALQISWIADMQLKIMQLLKTADMIKWARLDANRLAMGEKPLMIFDGDFLEGMFNENMASATDHLKDLLFPAREITHVDPRQIISFGVTRSTRIREGIFVHMMIPLLLPTDRGQSYNLKCHPVVTSLNPPMFTVISPVEDQIIEWDRSSEVSVVSTQKLLDCVTISQTRFCYSPIRHLISGAGSCIGALWSTANAQQVHDACAIKVVSGQPEEAYAIDANTWIVPVVKTSTHFTICDNARNALTAGINVRVTLGAGCFLQTSTWRTPKGGTGHLLPSFTNYSLPGHVEKFLTPFFNVDLTKLDGLFRESQLEISKIHPPVVNLPQLDSTIQTRQIVMPLTEFRRAWTNTTKIYLTDAEEAYDKAMTAVKNIPHPQQAASSWVTIVMVIWNVILSLGIVYVLWKTIGGKAGVIALMGSKVAEAVLFPSTTTVAPAMMTTEISNATVAWNFMTAGVTGIDVITMLLGICEVLLGVYFFYRLRLPRLTWTKGVVVTRSNAYIKTKATLLSAHLPLMVFRDTAHLSAPLILTIKIDSVGYDCMNIAASQKSPSFTLLCGNDILTVLLDDEIAIHNTSDGQIDESAAKYHMPSRWNIPCSDLLNIMGIKEDSEWQLVPAGDMKIYAQQKGYMRGLIRVSPKTTLTEGQQSVGPCVEFDCQSTATVNMG